MAQPPAFDIDTDKIAGTVESSASGPRRRLVAEVGDELPVGAVLAVVAPEEVSDAEVDAVTATSSEGLRNLFDLLGAPGNERLRGTPLFVPHARIAGNARALGCRRVIETAPGDEGLVAGLAAFWAKM